MSKWDLKVASDGADRRSGSREFHTDGTDEVTASFENKQADEDQSCLAG